MIDTSQLDEAFARTMTEARRQPFQRTGVQRVEECSTVCKTAPPQLSLGDPCKRGPIESESALETKTGLKRFDDNSASYLASYLADQKGEEKRRQFNQRLPSRLIKSLKIVAALKGLRLSEAVEQALLDWIERNRPPSVTVNVYQPISVSVSKINHVEVQLAVERLTRLTGILERCSDEYRAKWREDLLRELRKAYILEQRTRDPELQQIIATVETHLK